jgi:hypothetical protein
MDSDTKATSCPSHVSRFTFYRSFCLQSDYASGSRFWQGAIRFRASFECIRAGFIPPQVVLQSINVGVVNFYGRGAPVPNKH